MERFGHYRMTKRKNSTSSDTKKKKVNPKKKTTIDGELSITDTFNIYDELYLEELNGICGKILYGDQWESEKIKLNVLKQFSKDLQELLK